MFYIGRSLIFALLGDQKVVVKYSDLIRVSWVFLSVESSFRQRNIFVQSDLKFLEKML